MEQEKSPVALGAVESPHDYRTLTSDMLSFAAAGSLKEDGKVALDYAYVNDLCDQKKIGICTKCAVRMACEVHFKDGVRLDEYWGYLMGKTLIDDPLYGYHFEGSSAFTMLKSAHKYGVPEKKMLTKFPLKTDGTYREFIAHFQATYGGKIPAEILANATKHKIPGYYAVDVHPMSLAKEIQNGKLPVIRMVVGENFYTDKDGNYTRRARDLFPLRIPKKIESGHLMVMNEHEGLDNNQVNRGPNSWSRTWGDRGFYEFVFGTQAPDYFTEAWAIADRAPEILTHVKQLPEAKNFRYPFLNQIEYGQENEEVKKLHVALAILGYLNVALSEWGIYGNKTADAVLRYQKDRKVLPVAQLELYKGRYVHELTLAALRKDINKT